MENLRIAKPINGNTKLRVKENKEDLKNKNNLNKKNALKTVKKYFKLPLVIVWMLIIFFFSNQSGDVSVMVSNGMKDILTKNEFLNKLFLFFPIRKCAHIFLYFMLSFLIYKVGKDKIPLKYLYFLNVFICFTYAIIDELHQLFVFDRGASVKDVLIDTTSALICISIIFIKNKITDKLKDKKIKNKN